MIATFLAILLTPGFAQQVCTKIECADFGDTCTASGTFCRDPNLTTYNNLGRVACLDGICQYSREGDQCELLVGCPTGGVGYKNTLFCNTTSNKCQHYPRIGEPCNESIHAILSVHCAEGFCDEQTNVCKEFPQKGEECKYYNNIYNCADGLYCGDYICHEVPDLGDLCDESSLFDVSCKEGYCNKTTHTCVPFPHIGEYCESWGSPNFANCTDGFCNTTSNRCQEYYKLGEQCKPENYVGTCKDSWCDTMTGICTKLPETGETCNPNTVLPVYGACTNGYCDIQTRVCIEFPKLGENCTPNYDVCQRLSDQAYCDTKTNTCIKKGNLGEYCDPQKYSTCTGTLLYCASDSVCREYPDEGDFCNVTNANRKCLKDSLYCDSTDNICKKKPKAGEPCAWTTSYSYFSSYICEEGTYCNSSSPSDFGVCIAYPSVGEKCYNDKCKEGLYCNSSNLCSEYPNVGEECYNDKCKEGLFCLSQTCVEASGKEGHYCGTTWYSNTYYCDDGLFCNSSDRCQSKVNEGEKCESSKMCIGSPEVLCLNGRCTRLMSVKEGEECAPYETTSGDLIFDIFPSIQCVSGCACAEVKNATGSRANKCVRVKTKLSDNLECGTSVMGTQNCPDDSTCQCNDIRGKLQCIPKLGSSQELYSLYLKAKNLTDIYAYQNYLLTLTTKQYYYNAYIRCKNFYEPESTSESKEKGSSGGSSGNSGSGGSGSGSGSGGGGGDDDDDDSGDNSKTKENISVGIAPISLATAFAFAMLALFFFF